MQKETKIAGVTAIEVHIAGKLWHSELVLDADLPSRFSVLRTVAIRSAGADPWVIYFVKKSRMRHPAGERVDAMLAKALKGYFSKRKLPDVEVEAVHFANRVPRSHKGKTRTAYYGTNKE